MNFNKHSELEGKHAILSASKYAWIRYTDDKMRSVYKKHRDSILGTRLHEFAAEAIELKIKFQEVDNTLNMYVNDAISFGMTPEVILYYSQNAFGTADAISFRPRKGQKSILRIHDLKTGVSKTSFDQLYIYTAYFCLEYGVDINEIDVELRIYQHSSFAYVIMGEDFEPSLIEYIMNKIKAFDEIIDTEASYD